MSLCPNLIYEFRAIKIKIPLTFCMETNKLLANKE